VRHTNTAAQNSLENIPSSRARAIEFCALTCAKLRPAQSHVNHRNGDGPKLVRGRLWLFSTPHTPQTFILRPTYFVGRRIFVLFGGHDTVVGAIREKWTAGGIAEILSIGRIYTNGLNPLHPIQI
jgi:hypothetical protein